MQRGWYREPLGGLKSIRRPVPLEVDACYVVVETLTNARPRQRRALFLPQTTQI